MPVQKTIVNANIATFSFLLNKLNPEEIAFVGDQLITDILGANRNESISILVNPIGAFEPLGTKINRFFEKFIYKKLNKTGVLNKGVYYE